MAGAETFRVGLRIDRYELVRQVAEGGFGVIYVARDVNLGRDLAIKFLLPQHNSNQEIVNRFVNEARTLARVVHPGIVTVYESGEVSGTNTPADGTAFILMELLEGETLSQRLKRTGPLPPQHAMEICRQVANALHAAHQLGMIHRDLKPDNIMLVKDPAIAIGERAKVLDFGIAKNAGANTNATQIGMVFGTPAYMSPEQCRSSADVTPASDVYSLGCILFELLIGRPPFPGTGMGELFAHHLMSTPPSARSLNPSLPKHLDDVIAAMLAKDPSGRPANMEVIERILEDSRLGDKPARTRTLGGATLLAGALPFSKPGEMPAPRLITPVMGVPSTTERGVGRAAADAGTLLGATRPKMPTAEQAMEIMRARSPSQPNVPTQAVPMGNAHLPTAPVNVGNAHLPTMAVNTRSHPATGPHMPTMAIAPSTSPTMAAVPGSGPNRPGTGPQPMQSTGPIPPMGAPRMANPTTVSNAVGQQTARASSGGGSKLWLIGAVIGAIAIAVTIVLVAGGGNKEAAKEPDPIGSNPVVTPPAGSNAVVAPPPAGSNAIVTPPAGSNTVVTPPAGSNTGSAATGSDAGSATPMVGSNAAGSNAAGSNPAMGSNAGSASGSNAGSAMHAGSSSGSNAGSATHAGSAAKPIPGNGSATHVQGDGTGSAKKIDKHDPKAGSGSAKKCVGRECVLDDGHSF